MNNVIYPKDLEGSHERIRKLRTILKETEDKLKRKISELSRFKDLYNEAIRRVKKLEKQVQDLKEEIKHGYKQQATFDPKKSGIYRIYNKTTGESYVGQSSVNVRVRCESHYMFSNATQPDDWRYDLQHNPQNYKYEILEEGVSNQRLLDKLEVYYIGYYRSFTNGYNKTIGGKFNELCNRLKNKE